MGDYGRPTFYRAGAILNPNKDDEEFLGTIFSNVELKNGDSFTRPSAGGGGLGDPLTRDVNAVLEDVIDEYVSLERAKLDYGVVIHKIDRDIDAFEIDMTATVKERDYIRKNRHRWLETDPIEVEQMYNKGEINQMDVVRKYGVIMDYQTNTELPISTEQYREAMKKRSLAYW